jgi:flagellar motor switch protein FliN
VAEEQGSGKLEDSTGVGTPAKAGGEIPSQVASKSAEAVAAGGSSAIADASSVASDAGSTEAQPVEAHTADAQAADAQVGEGGDPATDQAAIDELLRQAAFDDPSAVAESAPAEGAVVAPDAEDFKLPNFNQVMQEAQVSSIDLLKDVELNVKIELGRSRMLVEDVLKLGEGSVVELDKLAGDPVDVFVNDRLVARGEVLVLNDNFCVRVNEILAGAKEEF